jgi:hypothetical protein
MSRTLSIVFLIAAILAGPASARAQRGGATDRTRLLELASTDTPAAVWTAWNALPAGQDKRHLGVELAIALKDLARGVELYKQWAAAATAPDAALLQALALTTATEMAAGEDQNAAIDACSAALRLQATHAPCRGLLEGFASRGTSVGQQALGAYALANAGLQPFPGLLATVERTLTPGAKLSFATRFEHLPAQDRANLLGAAFAASDEASRYQVMLALGNIPGPEAEAEIQRLHGNSAQVRFAKTVALAQHGDKASLETLAANLDSLDDYLKIPVSVALAQSGDAKAVGLLEAQLRSPVDLQRIYAANAARRLIPEAARATILNALKTGGPAIRGLAVSAAGRAALGTNEAVYLLLTSPEPELRARAIGAITDTLLLPSVAAPRRTPAPPRPRP